VHNGEELAAYGIQMLGTPYFYGAKIQDGALVEKKMKLMHQMYPKTVTKNYMQKAIDKHQLGKINTDCSGLIAGYRGINIGSSQLYQQAYKRMPIKEIGHFARGVVLWKKGHVGIYIGTQNGVPLCVEAKGINYGTIRSAVANTPWVYGLTFKDMEYDFDTKIEGNSKTKNPYEEPTKNLKYIKGEVNHVKDAVKWLQWELTEAGYSLAIDGMFGVKTNTALGLFQRSCKIVCDFICGPITREHLTADEETV
jgi:hypothetical protein